MPPKKLPPRAPQQKIDQKLPQKPNPGAPKEKQDNRPTAPSNKPPIPEQQVKQSSSTSAQLALEATKKAYDLRQAAYGAGDPNAREEILAKAINKEIEAESFGKAAKYTRSGAFQGLAAGAGLGVQPGVTLGKLTGAIVGGLVSSLGALLGGGAGSVYGAISGPFWDLGQMASQGVRSIVGDFPNWEATSSQKKALEKMVLGAQQTKPPTQEELEQMRDDNGGGSSEDYKQFARDLTQWIPSMPSMPSMPSASSMPSIPSISSLTGTREQSQGQNPPANNTTADKSTASTQNKQARASHQLGGAPKFQSASPTSNSQPFENKQSVSPTENVAKNKPKKLEVRSQNGLPQQNQAPVRKAPPKLETKRGNGAVNGGNQRGA